ncbi:glycosyltransferase [Tenuifilum osseticum]|uniref:glycosyltransferase n=1 Tax=Tenuifilum osseticum TaxID=3374723 RepID=UPI0034E4249B
MRIQIFSTSYIVTDQRLQRVANSLATYGYSVKVFCRKHKNLSYENNKFNVKYINPLFEKGPLFYFFYNLRIFLRILFSRSDIIYSNDLDTLPGCALGSIVRCKKLIYDSHELFTEVPELIGRPITKFFWRIQEKIFVKRAKAVITVSEGVANELKKRYNLKNVEVIRNVPIRTSTEVFKDKQPIIIYQGALNMGRGIELAIEMMKQLPCYKLLIVGKGDIEIKLRRQMLESDLSGRVQFLGQLTPENLRLVTPTAWLGLSLEEDMGLNYRYALPNKLFDYLAAHVPVLVSDLPEMKRVVEEYGIGIVAQSRKPIDLANQIADFFEDKEGYEITLKNVKKAAEKLCWQNEEPRLLNLINSLKKG